MCINFNINLILNEPVNSLLLKITRGRPYYSEYWTATPSIINTPTPDRQSYPGCKAPTV